MSAAPKTETGRAQLGTLTNTILECSDLERTAAFYTEKLGFPVQASGEGWVVVDGGAGVVVMYGGDDPHITLGFTGADLAAARAALEARGADPGPIAAHPTGHHFIVTDPEGNRVMIAD